MQKAPIIVWRDIHFRKTGPTVAKSDVTTAEKEVGKFSDDYREYLLTVNGGTPQCALFSYEANGVKREGRIAWFFEIDQGEESAEESLLEYFEDHSEILPDGICPIARVDADDLLAIGTSGKTKGQIFVWHRADARGTQIETSIDGEIIEYPRAEEALYLVAKSFSEFIQLLRDANTLE